MIRSISSSLSPVPRCRSLLGIGPEHDERRVDARQRDRGVERAVEHVGRVERGGELGAVAEPVCEVAHAGLDRGARAQHQDDRRYGDGRDDRETDDEPHAQR